MSSTWSRKHQSAGARMLSAAAVLALAPLTLTACAPSNGTSGLEDGIQVVASTNVWGDVAHSVAGEFVEVTSIIDSTAEDPHEFSAGARELQQVSKADIIIVNGGGYDDFMTDLIEGSSSSAVVIDVSVVSAPIAATTSGEPNEHYWYDLESVQATAELIEVTVAKLLNDAAVQRGAASPTDDLDTLAATAAEFLNELEKLQTLLAEDKSAHSDTGGYAKVRTMLMTEALPQYLLEDAGYADQTPPELAQAVEAGNEIPVVALQRASELLTGDADVQVDLLAVTQEDLSSQTQLLIEAAAWSDVDTMMFSELLPDGKTYLEWMREKINELMARD